MRSNELRAKFSGFKLPGGTLPGTYEVILEGGKRGQWGWRYFALLAPIRAPFHDARGKPLSFAESKLEEGKCEIAKMFEKQVSEWRRR